MREESAGIDIEDGLEVCKGMKLEIVREPALKNSMEDKKILFDNIDKIHTTEMGIDRIKRNLRLDTVDVVAYCKNKILDENCNIYRQGKNWYCEIENLKITINAYSYTIITAHIIV